MESIDKMNLKKRIPVKHIRVDPEFNKFLKEVSLKRIIKKVDIEKRSSRELSKMAMNCPSFPRLKLELESIPKKKEEEIK